MQYKPSNRYSQLRTKLIITKSLTREEAEEFMRLRDEEAARLERFTEFLEGFHERQAQERVTEHARREAFIRSLDPSPTDPEDAESP